jgi:hypothetical protein
MRRIERPGGSARFRCTAVTPRGAAGVQRPARGASPSRSMDTDATSKSSPCSQIVRTGASFSISMATSPP